MKNLLNNFHPGFEALSAWSDLNDVDRAGSRLTSHVARCAECRATVDGIRSLGNLVRTAPEPAVPVELWPRIRVAMVAEGPARGPRETPPPDHVNWEEAPALKPTRHWPVATKRVALGRWGIGLLAAAVVIGVLAWPGDRALNASGTSRLTLSPGRPVPGGTVTVLYRPTSWLRGQPRLVLVGRYVTVSAPRLPASAFTDSVATLVRQSDGNYTGRVRLPAGFLAAQFSVSDSAGRDGDMDGFAPWVLVGGSANGGASLAALLASIDIKPQVSFGITTSLRPRQAFSATDSLKRYFPDHPAGWAYAREHGGKGSAFERLVAFFRSSERKYTSFYDELWPRKDVDAERLHDMVVFANTIQEPDEVNRWARRFAREHPDDPRAFGDLLMALHQVELREPVALADSMRPWVPVLDAMLASGAPVVGCARGLQEMVTIACQYNAMASAYAFIQRYGDSETQERWRQRIESLEPVRPYWRRDYSTDAQARRTAESRWLAAARVPCVRGYGFRTNMWLGDWASACERDRMVAFAWLARAKYLDGDPTTARVYADSALRTPLENSGSMIAWTRGGEGTGPCARLYAAYEWGGKASLALNDTVRAIHDLVSAASLWGNPHGSAVDSARSWLGGRIDRARFDAAVDSATRFYQACEARRREAIKARNRRYATDSD